MLVEVVGGVVSGSLALLSDAAHMLTDILALGLALVGYAIGARPPDEKRTYGFHRAEILAALVNGVILVGLSLVIAIEAGRRVMAPQPVDSKLMMVIAIAGLLANLVSMYILRSGRADLNTRGAILHITADAASSVGVIIGSWIITTTGWTVVDPILSALLSIFIVVGAYGLLRDSVNVLMEATPKGMRGGEVRRAILAVPGVRTLHDLHIWVLSSGVNSLSVHIVASKSRREDECAVMTRVKDLLRDKFDLTHTTIQVETESFRETHPVH